MQLFQNSVLRNHLQNIDTILVLQVYEVYKKELTSLQIQIDNTDKQIDEMVYELYGFSEYEVAMVEGN